jgi:hypothetical protein
LSHTVKQSLHRFRLIVEQVTIEHRKSHEFFVTFHIKGCAEMLRNLRISNRVMDRSLSMYSKELI